MSEDDRYKFVDDLSILEIINLINIGITSFNFKAQVPSDIPVHAQYIPGGNLQSQDHLDKINSWTLRQKMLINEKKTKSMIFNFTDNYQFTTRLQLNQSNIEVVNEKLLLGTLVTSDLKFNKNTKYLIKKANSKMELLRKLVTFNAPIEDLKYVYIVFIRSILEQSSTVWHSMLSCENRKDIERVQKTS